MEESFLVEQPELKEEGALRFCPFEDDREETLVFDAVAAAVVLERFDENVLVGDPCIIGLEGTEEIVVVDDKEENEEE